MKIETAKYESPIGELHIAAGPSGVCVLAFPEEAAETPKRMRRRFGEVELVPGRDPAGAITALRAWFRGDLSAFDALPLDPAGTDFQRKVWKALCGIPAGETRSYAEIARKIGAASSIRAVGAANGANPIVLAIPCHRVIASDGTLCGYGGGLPRKRWLLDHEARHAKTALAV